MGSNMAQDTPFLIAGLLLGLGISLHCIGMCGPIAMALPGQKGGRSFGYQLLGRLLYNGGRIVTYMIMGAAFGSVGKLFVFAGLQQGLSIATGLVILAALFTPKRFLMKGVALPGIGWVYRTYKKAWAFFFSKDSLFALGMIGLINGLLPCGAVYMALAAAVGTGSAAKGALFMMAMGIGTSVTMLPISLATSLLTATRRQKLRRVMPAVACTLAIVFILRGLSLGIPFISPDMQHVQSTVEQGGPVDPDACPCSGK